VTARGAAAVAAGAVLFALLATTNAGGYRYGVSDQAFYIPAIARTADPTLFPRDAALFDPQARLWTGRHLLATAARWSSFDMPVLFGVGYVATLGVLFTVAVAFGRGLGLRGYAIAAFLTLLTLRHQIAKTGANSLEGYFHPRMLAFALGAGALAALVSRRHVAAITLVAAAGLVHPTTALWFGGVVGVALLVALDRPAHRLALAFAVAAGGASVFAVLQPDLSLMDDAWRAVLRDKDYLFAADWPPSAWALNLAYPVVIGALYRRRRLTGAARPGEAGLVAGLFVLVAAFLASVPVAAAGVAAVVQLQVSRVFWVLDYITAAYVAWWLLEDATRRRSEAVRAVCVAGLSLLAATRGYYVLRVAATRPLVQPALPSGTWTEAMSWLRQQPASWHVLADPGHAWKFGSSVRVAALKDTVLELGKDTAMALYDRQAAARVAERTLSLAGPLTPNRVVELASTYGVDVWVAEADVRLDRPVLYRNAGFIVYDLR